MSISITQSEVIALEEHKFKLMEQQCRGYRRHFFTTRVVNISNFLPKDVVNFSTLCIIKTRSTLLTFLNF